MTRQVDRNVQYMKETHGTTMLVTDYIVPTDKTVKFMREVTNDNMIPRLTKFKNQNELHQKIRNDNDYDDWEYGTEPQYFNNSALYG